MIKNYFKVAIRYFVRQKGYSIINIAGLAIGMAATMLILIYVFFELGFDRYNKDFNAIYRVNFHGTFGGESLDESITPAALSALLIEDLPEVKEVTRIFNTENRAVKYGEKAFYEDKFAFVDTNFFDFFTFPFIEGDPKNCLVEPFTVVITESTAKKYFGKEEAIGKVIKITNHFGYANSPQDTAFLRITGVIRDMPVQSHFHFDFLGSMGSIKAIADNPFLVALNVYTYVRVPGNINSGVASGKINDLYMEKVLPQLSQFLGMSEEQVENSGSMVSLDISPLKDIHLKAHGKYELEENGNIEYVRIFISVAFLILLLACINFINLSTARAVRRAKEVGIRKVVGSNRNQLILQFIGESFLFTVFSFILAMAIVEFAMPIFENITGYDLRGFYLDKSWFWISAAAIIIIVGFLSGLYPAIVLSSYKPIDVIRALPNRRSKGFFFRNSLVTFQFIITGIILLAVILISRQLNYIQSRELGFDKEKILVIERTDPIKTSVKSFMDELDKLPEVEKTCLSANTLCRGMNAGGFQYLDNNDAPKTLLTASMNVNYEFADVLGLRLREGRFFSRDYNDDQNIILNETAVRETGMKDPVGN
ncbi:MAG TPA: ABC transporter permease, partial [Bacteroidales bacterium]|nr:ABC transporter permease [Bacteroidales bacterium]